MEQLSAGAATVPCHSLSSFLKSFFAYMNKKNKRDVERGGRLPLIFSEMEETNNIQKIVLELK